MSYKIIHDTVHGSMKISEMVLELLDTPEVRRLGSIHQLGMSFLVFPGANHTRIEHSLGTGHVAGRMARALALGEEEQKLAAAAGILHDLGHGPYSHTLERVLHDRLGIDHMDLTKRIIRGEEDIIKEEVRRFMPDAERIPDILEKHDLDPRKVAELVESAPKDPEAYTFDTGGRGQAFFNDKRYLPQMIHGAVDADQIDYLLRDAHCTGVAHGIIDLDRLIQTITIHNNDLVVHSKGASAIEGMLVARGLMYSSVYFHKTSRIAEGMLARAVEALPEDTIGEVQTMVDPEFMNWLQEQGNYQKEIAIRLRYRRLFKKAMSKDLEELTDREKEVLYELSNPAKRRLKEEMICRRAGLREGYVLLDIPLPEVLLSEPRIGKTDIKVLEGGKVRPFSKVTPLGRALQLRAVSKWAFMVACPEEHLENVGKAAERVLFG